METQVRFPRWQGLSAVLLVLVGAGSTMTMAAQPSVTVVRTEFRVSRSDGSVMAQAELPGTVLTLADGTGGTVRIRIDRVERDGKTAGAITLYALSRFDVANAEWKPFCKQASDGSQLAFPLRGVWTADGRHLPANERFEIACTSDAIGECVRAGYHPWQTRPDGTSLWDYHQACVRMLRADYCGDGRPASRDEAAIDMYDRLGIQRSEAGVDFSFEAAWGPNGAVCVARSRIPKLASLAALLSACPNKLRGRVGVACSEESSPALGDALLFNKSRIPDAAAAGQPDAVARHAVSLPFDQF